MAFVESIFLLAIEKWGHKFHRYDIFVLLSRHCFVLFCPVFFCPVLCVGASSCLTVFSLVLSLYRNTAAAENCPTVDKTKEVLSLENRKL